MATKKGKPKPQYTKKQKATIVNKVCNLYASQYATLESCCDASGISVRAFRYWVAEDADFAELYKKAKATQNDYYWEELVKPKAKSALLRRIEGETKKEVKRDGEMVNGKFVMKKKTETTSEILPDTTMTIFAMKGLYPEMFKERKELTGKDGEPLQSGPVQVVITATNIKPITSEAALLEILNQDKEG